ncbi:MAG: hypothetical protein COT39_04210 [Parcubacteria group bacterium CG08_land_8_20_14_0_20_48_21]|nr:MAG: hypothetical protein AUK21_00835 [Parcubacteria group bacterium CG2_30_48_51]PIS32518.1 MAG: hypothetical protein COT39_04210 [Parcubacteria group bacterium CG08_land_8_20_14_0_20_48_21]PIW79523.1 MAG: hypothetical protein COZ99_00530 [Parcubacteria group bacterium CG_4_8_14_3_um_filter_48_16]PIY78103.1 MAG: hypothetical protein COY83_01730 [Parcubacteria group bacterium CG_4_10_14_0_8_um_filter_48_154]PIZ77670.1 MAG: hypothetical protein COY03_02110 [bacterium CG_4_10_14_0_2_um_filter_
MRRARNILVAGVLLLTNALQLRRTVMPEKQRTRILLVEDERALIEMYRMQMQSLACDLLVAENIEDGFARACDAHPHIILLDIILPKAKGSPMTLGERDGLDLLKKLKTHPQTKHIPVVILTNLDTLEDRRRAMALGADAYWIKSELLPKVIVEKLRTNFLLKI